jgi:hypothetical protein
MQTGTALPILMNIICLGVEKEIGKNLGMIEFVVNIQTRMISLADYTNTDEPRTYDRTGSWRTVQVESTFPIREVL